MAKTPKAVTIITGALASLSASDKKIVLAYLKSNLLTNNEGHKEFTGVEALVVDALSGCCYCNAWCTGNCNTPGSCCYADCNGCSCASKSTKKK